MFHEIATRTKYIPPEPVIEPAKQNEGPKLTGKHMSRDMRFPTMWYVRPAKPQISLCIRTV